MEATKQGELSLIVTNATVLSPRERRTGHRGLIGVEERRGVGAERSDKAVDEAGVQVHDEYAEEGHLLARVLEDDARVVGLAAQAVGSHHHGQVIYIHLGLTHIHRLGKDLRG